MTAQIRAEFFKLRTVRSSWLLLAACMLISAAVAVAVVRVSASTGASLLLVQVAVAPAQFVWLIAAAFAIVHSAGEFTSRTIRTTVLLTPARRIVMVSKAVTLGIAGAVLSAVGTVTAAAAGTVTAAVSDVSIPAGGVVLWTGTITAAAAAALWAVLAAGLGILTRSIVVALTAVLIWRFVGEALLPTVAVDPATVTRWTPLGASNAMIGTAGLLPLWGGALLLVGYAAASWVIAIIAFQRADIS